MRFVQGTGYTFKNSESGEEISCTFILGNAKMLCFAPTSGAPITITKPARDEDTFSINYNGKSYTFVKPEKGTNKGNGLLASTNENLSNIISQFIANAKDIANACMMDGTSYHQDLGNGYIIRIRKMTERKERKPSNGKKKRK